MIRKSGKNIFAVQQEFNDLMRQMPTIVGKQAENFYKESFRRQGFLDVGVSKWPARKFPRKRDQGKKKEGAILVASGDLRRSVKIRAKGTNYVRVGSDLPYAQIHNEGGIIIGNANIRKHTREQKKAWGRMRRNPTPVTVRAHTRKVRTTIDKRQFMGESVMLTRQLNATINLRLRRIFGLSPNSIR